MFLLFVYFCITFCYFNVRRDSSFKYLRYFCFSIPHSFSPLSSALTRFSVSHSFYSSRYCLFMLGVFIWDELCALWIPFFCHRIGNFFFCFLALQQYAWFFLLCFIAISRLNFRKFILVCFDLFLTREGGEANGVPSVMLQRNMNHILRFHCNYSCLTVCNRII